MKRPNAAVLRRLTAYVGLVASIAACGGKDNTVTNTVTPSSCSFSLSPGSASHAAAGGTASVTVTTAANCSWTAAADADWVKVTGGSSGQGSGTVTYSVAPNTTATARSAAIKVLGANGQGAAVLHQITQQGTSCSFSVSPASASHAASGGTASLTVTTAANCSWTAASDADWVKVTGGSSGQGSGTVTYSVAPNTTATERSAAIKVSDATGQGAAVLHQIRQQGTTGTTGQAPMVKGIYTFSVQVARSCGWPMTAFAWPVLVEVSSYQDGTTVGEMLFPPVSGRSAARWRLYASPTRSELVPAQGSPGPVIAAYDVVLEGGRWEAGGPTRGFDGRGQVTDGIATGARQTLKVPNSSRVWVCGAEVKWSLRPRLVDPD